MRIDNARFTGSVDGSQAVASLSGSFTGSGHIELSNTASYNFASASISASNLILWRASGITDQTASLTIISETSDTASYVSSSNVDGPFGMDSIQSASFASSSISSSYALTSSYAISASHLIGLERTYRADFAGVTTFIASHNLNTEDIVVQVYQDDASTGNLPKQIVPDAITLNNLNDVQIDFAVATTGYVVVSRGGFVKSGSVTTALTASTANQVKESLDNGLGIETFSYIGNVAGLLVQLDTASAHFTDGVDKARAADTGSFVTGSVIVGLTQSFRLGDGTSYENYLVSSSHSETASLALTASFIAGQSYDEAVTSAVATTFNINHNLDSAFPIVASYNAANQQVIPDTVQIITNNRVDVTFAGAFTGNIVVKK